MPEEKKTCIFFDIICKSIQKQFEERNSYRESTDERKNCLSCGHSSSEPGEENKGDILHCTLIPVKTNIVDELAICNRWN
jgi:hypothetical protein